MSAEAHREEAAEHEREAREAERLYAAESPYGEVPYQEEPYDPAVVHLRLAHQHQKSLGEHLEAARILEEYEEAECGAFTPEIRIVCPLIGQVEAIEDVPAGVRVRLLEGVDVEAAIAHMRCHLAFARSHGRLGMDECPLYLRGVRVERVTRSRSIDLIPANLDDLEALRLRTSLHVPE